MDIYADTFDPTAPTAYYEVKRLTEELKEAHADYARVLAQRDWLLKDLGELAAQNYSLQEQIRLLKRAVDDRIHLSVQEQQRLVRQAEQAAERRHFKLPRSDLQSLRL